MDFNILLEMTENKPKDFTYVGIGSCPHEPDATKLDDAWDQLIPVFLTELIKKTDLTVRILHFDPAFTSSHMKGYMPEYFKVRHPSLKLVLAKERDDIQIWTNGRIEMLIVSSVFEHKNRYDKKNDDWFLQSLADSAMSRRAKLVIQEYTGVETAEVFNRIYEEVSLENKDLFKKHVLYDFTYGDACHCMTNLTKYRPLYDRKNNFYNFVLYTSDEMRACVDHISSDAVSIVLRYYKKKFSAILNKYHVDYRRRLKGETCFNNSQLYNDYTVPDRIMGILQSELGEIVEVFRALKFMTAEKELALENYFRDYILYDVYDWYNKVNALKN